MKKMSIFAVAAMAIAMASCTAQTPKADLKTDLDSLSYAMGLAQTDGLKQHLIYRMGVDTTYMADFIKGLNETAQAGSSKKQTAYVAGLQIGQQVNQMCDGINQELFGNDSVSSINRDNFLAGFIAGALEKGGLMTPDAARDYAMTNMETYKAKMLAERFAENKAAGEKFLAENKTKEGVQTTESGLQYKVLVEGKGAVPTNESKVKVHYTGKLIDGTKFDSSYDRKDKDGNAQPAVFGVTQVIKGWTEALQLMPVGSKWELYIPQELAYGTRDMGTIKPFSTLVFEVELVGIEDKK